jgi:nitrite reductase (NADH) large subunit
VTYLIIGNGAAGIAGALSIRRNDREGAVIILSDEAGPFYSRPLIIDVMTGRRTRADLTLLSEEEYCLQGLDMRTPVTVKELRIGSKAVITTRGVVRYDKLLIASGARPKAMPFEGEGVFSLRSLNDAEAIHKRLQRGVKRVLIYGAGPVGIKAGHALLEAGIPATFIVTSPHILGRVFDRKSAEHFRGLFERRGALFYTDRQIARIVRRKGFKGIITDKGERVDGDLLIVGKGVVPDVAFAGKAGIEVGQGIIVNDRMETSALDVYAAGDATESPMAGRGEKEVTAIWPLASSQGKIAGMNMTGSTVDYPGSVGSNSLECFGTKAISMGVIDGEGYDAMILEEDDSYRKYVFDEERLVGAVLVGNIRNAGVLLHAIREGLKVRGTPLMRRTETTINSGRMEVLF